jgi:hypothetical protein
MKKILLSVGATLICMVSFAQLSMQDSSSKAIANGDTVKVSGTPGTLLSDKFFIYNSGGSLKVNVHSLPTKQNVNGAVYSICVGTLCYATVPDTNSFQVPKPFTVATGQYSNMLFADYDPAWNQPGVTTIEYVVYDNNINADSTWFFVQFNAISTGIAALANNIHISSLYPNPASSNFNFTYHTNYDAQLSVYNSIGQLVKTMPLSSSKESANVNTTDMPSGVYICKLQAAGAEPAYRRLVVSH